MESLGQNGKTLSIYEIGIIDYKVKCLLQLSSVFDTLIGECIERIDYEGKYYSVKTTKDFHNSEMHMYIRNALSTAIANNKQAVLDLISELKYTDLEYIYNLIQSRVSMFYNLLRIGERDFAIIVV